MSGIGLSRRAFAAGLAVVPLAKGKPGSIEHTPEATAPAPPVESAWRAQVFDDHQIETVAVLAELIIPKTDTPGAREALVHQHLDRILSVSPEPARVNFLEGLWWLDGYCLQSEAKPFIEVSPAGQMEILTKLYNSSEPDLQPGSEFVHLAKNWTAKIYYSTEVGVEELNKGGRVPSTYERPCTVRV
jgi:Gluconate 2-dehydrogenase subunit 3